MFDKPETYEDLIRKKRCIEITRHYEITKEDLETIYNFLKDNPNAIIKCNSNNIVLVSGGDAIRSTIISSRCVDSSIDGMYITNHEFKIYPHYTPSSSSGSSWSSSGGSSSNNNNNNR